MNKKLKTILLLAALIPILPLALVEAILRTSFCILLKITRSL